MLNKSLLLFVRNRDWQGFPACEFGHLWLVHGLSKIHETDNLWRFHISLYITQTSSGTQMTFNSMNVC